MAVVRPTPDEPRVALGGSLRARLALMKLGRALAVAAIDGCSFMTPDDVKAAAVPVLTHRLILRPEHLGLTRLDAVGGARSARSCCDAGGGAVVTFRPSLLTHALAVAVAWAACPGSRSTGLSCYPSHCRCWRG